MNDDLGKKVEQIAQLLGQEKVPDNLKELVSLFAASMNKKEDDAGQTASAYNETGEKANSEAVEKLQGNDPEISPELLSTARKAMGKLNLMDDPRIYLLNAIKPFMNNRRQKKIGSCIQLLQVASLSRLLGDKEKQER
jgi:hypothetical protein